MIKVLFYHANDGLSDPSEPILFLGIASLYLKTHIEITQPEIAKEIEWLLPVQTRLTDKEFVEYCNNVKPDIICTSHYIWNHSFLLEQLERIKDKIPKNIIIAAGGPSIDVNIDPAFFEKYPFIDFAVYGAGEQAFTDLVTSIVTKKKLIAFNTSNIAWFDQSKNKTVIAEFKYVPQLKISPFLHNEEFFTAIVKHLLDRNIRIVVPYELTRGCPYSCTFCDWNSGLSNKVTRRKETFKQEIDLFQLLNIRNIYLSDANVGQYDEDIEVVRYFAEKI